jgi:tRNA pseudouridine38-40 synthase
LDFDAMNEAAKYLIGRQDFASFCRSNTDVKTTICDLTYACWEVKEDGHAVFTITADRFLRNMVRAVVGTLFLVGQGKMTKEQFAEVITKQNRCSAGDSAPAQGLYLTHIEYPEEIFV